ncbi:hypothetical protein SAMN02910291_02549 [Desulfovibrio desulfuricans]|uniref:Uncharacterized protein n=1 Tax=Desulfovibrio desulfuricans TaxID=876 RepID=A0AA94HUS3_DESDE|nr:hypothetical protein SAMN02910291_02549 [Desulfovibrio desulfuricans]SPD34515.1 Hypothetical protein DSVG11_0390 [Desulfovibrio sp. G11]
MQCPRIYVAARPKSVGDVILKGKNALENGLRGGSNACGYMPGRSATKKAGTPRVLACQCAYTGKSFLAPPLCPVYVAAIWAEGAVARQILSGVGIGEGFLSFLCIEKAICSGLQKITGGWVVGPPMRWDQSSFAQARLRFQARIAAP